MSRSYDQHPGDYYAILGVLFNTSQDDLKRAYRRLANEWDPDRSDDPDAPRMSALVNKAWDVLGNPKRRAEYDEVYHRWIEARAEAERIIAEERIRLREAEKQRIQRSAEERVWLEEAEEYLGAMEAEERAWREEAESRERDRGALEDDRYRSAVGKSLRQGETLRRQHNAEKREWQEESERWEHAGRPRKTRSYPTDKRERRQSTKSHRRRDGIRRKLKQMRDYDLYEDHMWDWHDEEQRRQRQEHDIDRQARDDQWYWEEEDEGAYWRGEVGEFASVVHRLFYGE